MALPLASGQVVGTQATDGSTTYEVVSVGGINVWDKVDVVESGVAGAALDVETSITGDPIITDNADTQAALLELSAAIVDEVVESAGVLSGVAPAGALWGVDTLTGQAYYVNAGNWAAVPTASVDLNINVTDQTGGNGTGTLVPAAPATATPDIGDVEQDIYDDVTIYFTAGATNWTTPAVIEVPRNVIDLATAISPAADDATGAIGVSTLVAKQDHKHPAQGVSSDTNNLVAVGADGLHSLPMDPSGFASNLAPADATLQAVADKFDAFVAGKDRLFADDTTVAPATSGEPVKAEILAFAGTNRDTIIGYNGTDVDGDYTHVWHIDQAGSVTLLRGPIPEAASSLEVSQAANDTKFVTPLKLWNKLFSEQSVFRIEGEVDFTTAEPVVSPDLIYVSTVTGTSNTTSFATTANDLVVVDPETGTWGSLTPAASHEGIRTYNKATDTEKLWDGSAWVVVVADDTSDIFKQLSEWTATNAQSITAGNSIGAPSAVINDNAAADFGYYGLANNLPLTADQTVRFKFVKTSGNLNAIILQATDITTNTSSVAIDSITGATTAVVAGTGVAPTIVSTTVTDSTIEVVATFPANTDYTTWLLYPSTVPNSAPTVADSALTGTQEILELDLNYAFSSAESLTDNLLTAVANNVDLTAGNHDRVDTTSTMTVLDTVTLPAAPAVGEYGEFYNGSTVALVLAKDAGDAYVGTPATAIPASSGFSWRAVAANVIEVVGTGDAGGGMIARGIATSDADLGAGIYSMDASGAAFDFTLPAATGSQDRYLMLGADVVTNNATVKIQAGETMNSVTDATYTMSVNDEVVLFIDDQVGNWSAQVVGSSTSESLARGVFKFSADWSNTSVNNAWQVAQIDTATYDSDSAFDAANYKYVVPKSGDYHVDCLISYVNNSAGTNDLMNVAVRLNGVTSALSLRHDISDQIGASGGIPVTLSGIVPGLVAGDELTIEIFDADDVIVHIAEHSYWSVQQLPSSEVVLAGHVVPTELSRMQATLSAAQTTPVTIGSQVEFDTTTFTAGSSVTTDGAGSFTLKANKTYRLTGQISIRTAGDVNTSNTFQWVDVTGAANLGNLSQIIPSIFDGSTNNEQSSTPIATALFTPVVDSIVELQLASSNNIDNINATGSFALIEELPTSTVVDPGTVPVEDLHRFTLTKTSGQTTTPTAYPAQEILTWDAAPVDTAGGVSGNTYVIPSNGSGTWKFKAAAETDQAGTMDGHSSIQITVNGAEVSRSGFATSGDNFGAGSSNDINYGGVDVEVDVVAGDIIAAHVSMSQGIGITATTTTTFFQGRQVAAKTITYLNPAFTEAKDLHRLSINTTAIGNFPLVSDDAVQQVPIGDAAFSRYDPNSIVSGNKLVFQEDGDYKIEANVVALDVSWTLRLSLNGSVAAEMTNNNTIHGGGRSISMIRTFSAGDELWFTTQDSTADIRTLAVTVEQLPSAEYVTPGDVPVEDLEDLIFSGTGNASQDIDVLGATPYANWRDFQAAGDYKRLRFEIYENATGAHAWFTETKEVVLDSLPFTSGTDDVRFYLGDGGQLSVNSETTTITVASAAPNLPLSASYNIRVWGIKAQKTVTYLNPAFTEATALDKLYIQTTGGGNLQPGTGGYQITTSNTSTWYAIGAAASGLADSERIQWLPSDAKITDGTSFVAGTNEITSAYTGRVKVTAQVTGGATPSNPSGDTWTLYLVKNGNAGTVIAHAQGHSSSASYGADTTTIEHEFDITAGDTLDLRVEASSVSVNIDGTSFKIERVPSHEYVTPGDVPVEDLDYQFLHETASTPAGQIQTVTSVPHAGSTTLIEPASRVDLSTPITSNGTGVTVGANDLTIGSDGRYSFTADVVTITTENVGQAFSYSYVQLVKNGTEIVASSHESDDTGSTNSGRTRGHALVWGGDLSAGDTLDVRIQGHSSTGTFVSSYSILLKQEASKTVINTTDVPVNDQAASGYMDFGTMRMQWGVSDPTSASGLGTITLPVPFANSDYSVVGSTYIDTRTIRIYGHTTTSVNIHTRTPSGSGVSDVLRWQAIGLKP